MNFKHILLSFLMTSAFAYGQNSRDIPIGDTLTVVQRPILNIPEIVTPNEQMDILCLADASTSGWQVQLLFNEIVLDLPIVTSEYDIGTELWTLTVNIPNPDLYELYDLKVTALNGIMDITRNSVHVIPEERESYYFIHITDTHLPVKIYWTDDPEAALNDTTTMIALRKIIRDVNLINPEFVLLTGDVVNEGELEDFENGRVYTKAKRILGEFEVPVYLVAGNHDLGGWVDTPPPQGTARRNWWRFFGWKSLEFSPTYTQDYTFQYGNTIFLGMESYVNYDSFMYSVYGYYSYISSQLDWLNEEIENIPDGIQRVLFTHYDFSDQLDFYSNDLDMVLSGHTHSNWDDFTHPYIIGTRAAYPAGEAYRVIKVNPNGFEPQYTSYATNYGPENLTITFSPSNDGTCDSVSAMIHNNNNVNYEYAKIKFIMPFGGENYDVSNGELLQIDRSGEFDICYVNSFIPANSDIPVSISRDGSAGLESNMIAGSFRLHPAYPNPFNPTTTIGYELINDGFVTITIYDMTGREVETLVNRHRQSGFHIAEWNADNAPAGTYFVKLTQGDKTSTQKIILLK